MLRVNIRTPLKVIFDTNNIIGGLFRLSIQYVSQLLTVSNQKLNKTVILTCRCSMCIENESTGKYTCSHAPYTRFTSVVYIVLEATSDISVQWGKSNWSHICPAGPINLADTALSVLRVLRRGVTANFLLGHDRCDHATY